MEAEREGDVMIEGEVGAVWPRNAGSIRNWKKARKWILP